MHELEKINIFSTNDELTSVKYGGFVNVGNNTYQIDGDNTSYYQKIVFNVRNLEYDVIQYGKTSVQLCKSNQFNSLLSIIIIRNQKG